MAPLRRQATFLILVLATLILLGAAVPAAGAPSRIAVLPFTIHAEKDLSFLNNGIRAMLVARLIHEGLTSVGFGNRAAADEAEAVRMGANQSADYVLTGTLTLFGSSVSTDAAFLDVETGRALVRFSRSGDDSGDVIQHIDLLSRQINQDVFGIAPKTFAAPTGSAPAYPQAGSAAPATPGAAGRAVPASTGPVVWKSHRLTEAVVSLTAGDVDGDGDTDLVTMGGGAIHVHRRAGETLAQITVYKADAHLRLIGVDAVDLNANGRDELFVTAFGARGRLDSFVLEWDGMRLRPIARELGWYFRRIDDPDRGRLLVGQKGGTPMTSGTPDLEAETTLFRGGVIELSWRGDRLTEGDRIPLPGEMNVFGFATGDAFNDGRRLVVGFDASENLVAYDDTGRQIYKSAEAYGGSLNYLEYSTSTQFSQKDRYYLPLRVHVADLDGDGAVEIITARNADYAHNFLSRLRKFTSGKVVCLRWEKISMKEKWATDGMPDYVSDTAIADLDDDGRPEVIFAVNAGGGILEKADGYIVSYQP